MACGDDGDGTKSFVIRSLNSDTVTVRLADWLRGREPYLHTLYMFVCCMYIFFCICTGHFLHLRLLPTTTIRTLKSPTFGMTKETCRLEMFVHQSGNKNGKLRVVIEAVNSSSWVPNQRVGFEVCVLFRVENHGIWESRRKR